MSDPPTYIDQLMNAPVGSLLIGSITAPDENGQQRTNAFIDGTPEGFRTLAGLLLKMAESVESADDGSEWGLVLHPDDVQALRTHHVEAIALSCKPALELGDLDSAD